MIAMLRSLDDHVGRIGREPASMPQNETSIDSTSQARSKSITETAIEALNSKRFPETVLIHEELVGCLWNQKQSPGQRDWMERESGRRSGISSAMQDSFRNAIIGSFVFENI
jgi:hypothetical protein